MNEPVVYTVFVFTDEVCWQHVPSDVFLACLSKRYIVALVEHVELFNKCTKKIQTLNAVRCFKWHIVEYFSALHDLNGAQRCSIDPHSDLMNISILPLVQMHCSAISFWSSLTTLRGLFSSTIKSLIPSRTTFSPSFHKPQRQDFLLTVCFRLWVSLLEYHYQSATIPSVNCSIASNL